MLHIHIIASENGILAYLSGNTNSACYIAQNFVCMLNFKMKCLIDTVSFAFILNRVQFVKFFTSGKWG